MNDGTTKARATVGMHTTLEVGTYEPEAFLRVWRTGQFDVPVRPLLAWLQGHRLLPLLAWRAEEEGWALPEAVAAAARHGVYAAAARSLIAQHQLSELADVAAAVDVPVVVVKGPVVAEACPDRILRAYNDLDLLVPAGRAEPLIAALLDTGYQSKVSGDRATHFPPLVPQGNSLRLEVHTALDHRPDGGRITFARWSARLQPWNAHPGLWVPDPVDHAVYLVDHAVLRHELRGGLQLLTDLYFWTSDWTAAQWAACAARSREIGLDRAVGLAMALTAWFWDEPLPDAVRRQFPAPPDDLLARSQALALGALPTFMPHVWRDLPADSPLQWIRYAVETFLGDPEYRRGLPLRDRIRFYLRRPFCLWQHYAPSLWRLLTGKQVERGAWRAHRDVTAWLRGGSSTPPSPSERR